MRIVFSSEWFNSSNDLYPRDPKLRKINTVISSSVQLSLRNNHSKEFHAKIRHLRNDQVKRSACIWSDKVYRYTYACLSCNFVSLSPLKKIKNIFICFHTNQTALYENSKQYFNFFYLEVVVLRRPPCWFLRQASFPDPLSPFFGHSPVSYLKAR